MSRGQRSRSASAADRAVTVRPPVLLLVVAVVVGLGLGAITVLRPPVVGARVPPAGVQPVSSAQLVCPDAALLTDGGTTDITFTAPRLAGLEATDQDIAEVSPLTPDGAALASVGGRGPVGTMSGDGTEPMPVVVEAVGSLAPGLTASQLSRADSDDVRGLAGVECAEADDGAWFVGLGTEVGQRPRLVLVNPDETPAELDVLLYGPEGPVVASGTRNLVVAGRTSVALDLDALAPDLGQLAVEVRVRSGRVASAVLDRRVSGLTPQGVDWVAESAAPARTVIVAGVPAGNGPRMLQIAAPGELDARVEVRLLTAGGVIVPADIEELAITAGSVREVALGSATGGEAVAVELVADQPVVAAVRAVTGSLDGPQEFAVAVGTAPIDGVAVATDVRRDDDHSASLMLTGGRADDSEEASSVVLTFADPESGDVLLTERVSVPASTTVPVPLDDPRLPGRFAVTIAPSGTVYAVVQRNDTSADIPYFTVHPLHATRTEVAVPRVRHDLATGLQLPG